MGGTPQGGHDHAASSRTVEDQAPRASPSGPVLAMADAFCAQDSSEDSVVSATLGVEAGQISRLSASSAVQGSGGPPNGADQLAGVAFERTRHDYIASVLRKKSSSPVAGSSPSSSVPLSPGLSTALNSVSIVPSAESVRACEAVANLLAQEAAVLQGRKHWRPLPRDVLACIALNNAILATGARMDGKTRLGDFFASRARVALAACLDRPSEICVSALLCLAYYLMGVAGDGDTSQARLLIALANEMVDVLVGSGTTRQSQSTANGSHGAAVSAPMGPPSSAGAPSKDASGI